jgi:ATP phosphoribosyltransferase
MSREPLTLAMPKGRIMEEAVVLFGRAGYDLSALSDARTRKLVFDCGPLRVLTVKPSDVPTYVVHGAAELGVAGLDTLEEDGPDVYAPLDLGIGPCRLAVAQPAERPGAARRELHLRIASKYPRLTERWLASRGAAASIIEIHGSVELAPLVGLADQIVDLVSSGATLRDNGLVEVETILQVTSRLVVNRAAMKLRGTEIEAVIARLRAALGKEEVA